MAEKTKTRTIAVLNHKGGAGKTALTCEIAAYLALDGLKVLVIDLDPQVNLTKRIGYTIGLQEHDQEAPEATLFDMLDNPDETPMEKCMVPLWSIPNLTIVPGDPDIHDLIDLLPTKLDGALPNLHSKQFKIIRCLAPGSVLSARYFQFIATSSAESMAFGTVRTTHFSKVTWDLAFPFASFWRF